MSATLAAPLPAARLPLHPAAAAAARAGASAFEATGFEIGWDHAHHRLVPPAEHLHAGHPVRQGWQAGQAVFGTRTLRATPAVRKWLQLRLNAWLRGRAFEGVQVTPRYLQQIDVAHCPITREALTHATGTPSDASVDRVNNDAGYAGGNLAVMSVRANAVKGALRWDEALERAQRLECEEGLAAIDGLGAAEWLRVAVLASFATALPHDAVATLPLVVLPPNRLRLLNAVQALQVLLTLQFTRPHVGRRIAELTAAMPGADARTAYQVFMHTLLARRVAAGPQIDGAALRRALENAWTHPLVQRRWQRLALRLTQADCERLVELACRRGLAGRDCRWLPLEAATDGWALETRGYVAVDAPAGGVAASLADAVPQEAPAEGAAAVPAALPRQAALFA
jgi:hypothetical protein